LQLSALRPTLGFKETARAVEAALRPLAAPSIIAGVLLAFLAVTFGAAKLVAHLLHQPSRGSLLVLWTITTALGVALVRRVPSILK
jgi:hypothetical protein